MKDLFDFMAMLTLCALIRWPWACIAVLLTTGALIGYAVRS